MNWTEEFCIHYLRWRQRLLQHYLDETLNRQGSEAMDPVLIKMIINGYLLARMDERGWEAKGPDCATTLK